MREIKFRAWVEDYRIMDTVVDIEWVGGAPYEICIDDTLGTADKVWFSKYEIELMQYTGLKDKNGKEIYEGDIVKVTDLEDEIDEYNSDTGIGDVEWLDKWGLWYITEINNGLFDISNIGYIEVIGNIYENPELLEVE